MKFVLFGDIGGIRQLLRFIPNAYVVAICGASRRAFYFDELQDAATEVGCKLLIQPPKGSTRESHFIREIGSLRPDLIISNSYSMLIPEGVLRASRLGGLNIHASLLPKHRGPNPIQWAIIRGDRETGVTLHKLASDYDQGDIVDQIVLKIRRNDSWIDMVNKVDLASDAILERNIREISAGIIVGRRQDEEEATKNFRRRPNHSKFDVWMPVGDLFRLHLASLPPIQPAHTILSDGSRHEFRRKLPWALFTLAILGLRLRESFLGCKRGGRA